MCAGEEPEPGAPQQDAIAPTQPLGAGRGQRIVIRRWVQLVLLPLALLGIWELARAAGTIFLVLVIACLVALILAPPVRILERAMPREIVRADV